MAEMAGGLPVPGWLRPGHDQHPTAGDGEPGRGDSRTDYDRRGDVAHGRAHTNHRGDCYTTVFICAGYEQRLANRPA